MSLIWSFAIFVMFAGNVIYLAGHGSDVQVYAMGR